MLRKTVLVVFFMVALLLNTITSVSAWKAGQQVEMYTVQEGDTLYSIGRHYGIDYQVIKECNGLESNMILPGMQLKVSMTNNPSQAQAVFGTEKKFVVRASDLTKKDIMLLAKLIHAEARGETMEGKIAVGAVVINRMVSGQFPGSVDQIIFQKNKGVYQFTPVQNGKINLEPDIDAYKAAEKAVKGEDPTGGALFFYNPDISSDRWIRTLEVTKVIGNHVFAH